MHADSFTNIINKVLKPNFEKLLHDTTGKVKVELKKEVHKEMKKIPLLPAFEKKRIEKRIDYYIDHPQALKKLLGL